ncbi:MAG: hypothetical protein CM1200mP18_15410 [Gammaproteobacteria bacterium]|nr:MAG: hypothetical protein CM1200mP18_15410 [Gammaproteobacteria bacterium]
MRNLELGGNAFDAAVAAGLTLQVVEPHLMDRLAKCHPYQRPTRKKSRYLWQGVGPMSAMQATSKISDSP